MSKYPILFEANETEFKTHGIGVLSDAVQCDVTEELNGIFELMLVYPSSGVYFNELKKSRFIYADASKELGNQPFRIYRIMKLLNGLVTVYAQHISYDLGGIQLPPFTSEDSVVALGNAKSYSTTDNPFYFYSKKGVGEEFTTKTPKSVRAYLLGEKESFLQAYGGEFKFDKFKVTHMPQRGADNGYRIKYGVNLIDLNQEESIENTYTGIYPYYKDEYMFMDLTESYDLMYPHEMDVGKIPGKVMNLNGTFSHTKIANVDLSAEFEIAPLSTYELREVAEKYIEENDIGVPTVSLDVKFESLRKSPEYKDIAFMEDVNLGDTVSVDFVKLGVSAKARIISMIYDSLRHKIKRVSVGDAKNNIADTVLTIQNSVKQSETKIQGISRSVAKIEATTNANAAAVNLLVEVQEEGGPVVRGSVLVEAINGQNSSSAVKINADYVNLTGYVTVDSLKEDGTTVIDGSRIQTGQIVSRNFSDDYILVNSHTKQYEAGALYFVFSKKYIGFTTTKQIQYGYSIKYYEKTAKIEIVDGSDNIVETLAATVSDVFRSGTEVDVDISIYFSERGTKIDLENGEIISPQFALKADGSSYFGGKINTLQGTIGPFELVELGLSSRAETGALFGLGKGGIFYISSSIGESVKFSLGDHLGISEIPGLYEPQPHLVEIENANGDFLRVTLKTAEIIGSWKATPYTDTSAETSEIITKQDLINLGLITA